ncbi:MAG: sigma-70 family RNA polymerase sigma factor [Bacteroidia bacterium]|nr:sigma-70 family RNA polymerase sigma factor [Bacteroidia bacterium]
MHLLNVHHAAFVRYVRAMTKDSELARDVVGETLLAAYESFHNLRDPASFLFFLIAIARRQYWKMSRWGRLFTRMETKHEDLVIDGVAEPGVAHDVELLHAALAKLPQKQREALVLFELSGLSLNEVHALQGGSLSGVKSRIARARKKLAEMLGERQTEPRTSEDAKIVIADTKVGQ